jgi:hypothetical protein
MNIFDLDRLGERINQLDHADELYNCTAQLVIAAYSLTAALSAITRSEHHTEQERVAIDVAIAHRDETLAALKAFELQPPR